MNPVYKRSIIYYVEFVKDFETVINSQACYMFPFCFLKIQHLNCDEVSNHAVVDSLQAIYLTFISVTEYTDHYNLLQNSICIELY